MRKPSIGPPGVPSDFDDSSLVDFQVDPGLDCIRVVLSTPTNQGAQELWQLTFVGVLRLEFEITGSGTPSAHRIPAEVYAVYRDVGSDEERPWSARLSALGEAPDIASAVQHIVLASSHVRGWGDRG